jgi:uncharacterized protein (DUF433 family)
MAGLNYLGLGLYTLPEAARLLRVPLDRLRRWTIGYTFAGARFSEPLFKPDYPELAVKSILTFQDLMELFLVARFRQAGVSLQKIRATAQWAARRFETNYPFAIRRFHTDGKRLFAELESREGQGSPERSFLEPHTCQYVFSWVEEFFLKLDYENDLVSHFWPLGKERPVVLDPARSFGQPIDPATGVPTRVLADMHAAGESVEEVARWFRVESEAVRAAVEYERSLAKAA